MTCNEIEFNMYARRSISGLHQSKKTKKHKCISKVYRQILASSNMINGIKMMFIENEVLID